MNAQWEYKIIIIPEHVDIEDVLNDWGVEGWELTHFSETFDRVIFKRPKPVQVHHREEHRRRLPPLPLED